MPFEPGMRLGDQRSCSRLVTRRQTFIAGVLIFALVIMVLVHLGPYTSSTKPVNSTGQSVQTDNLVGEDENTDNPQSAAHPPVQRPAPSPVFVLDQDVYANKERPVLDPPFTAYDAVSPKEVGMVVPNIVHYIWLDATGDLRLTFSQYLAMRSTIIRQRPDKLYIHCNEEPHGVWWSAIKEHFIVNHITIPDTVYGQPIREFAHRSDILRILILEDMGGIYVDSDIFIVRPLDDLLYAPYTMGQAYQDCFWNSIMIAAPHAPFLDKFKNLYRNFNPNDWSETSSRRPAELASWFPDEVQVVDAAGFFSPNWDHNDIYEQGGEYDFFETGQYTYHAWNHYTGWRILEGINPKDVLTVDTSFNRMVRDLVSPDDVAIWESISEEDVYHDSTHG